MERIMRARPSPATAIALVALFVALGGTAFSALRIDSSKVVNNSLKSADLKNKKGVKDADVVPNSLTGNAINEATLSGVNASTLDNLDSADFLRSNEMAADANLLDGLDSAAFLRSDAKAADADQLDGLNSSDFLRSNAAVDADKVDGLDANSLIRVASASTSNAPNAVGDNDVLTTSITAPRSGFLFVVASVEAFNSTGFDLYTCQIELDGTDVDSSKRDSQLDGNTLTNREENCSTNAVSSVSSGSHAVVFEGNNIEAGTALQGADLGVLFIPFNATGG